MSSDTARRIAVALGEAPGDLLLRNGRVANMFTGAVEHADVVIVGDRVAGVGSWAWDAAEIVDLDGAIVGPALIDAHMHVESTLLVPYHLARVLAPRGTGAIVADPHEIGNVLGVPGVETMLAASEDLAVDCFLMAPSCVPASAFERSGATLGPAEVERLLAHERVLGLAEMMNYPGVLGRDAEVVGKVDAAHASGKRVDGHAPSLMGRELLAYAAAGIRSDHECTTLAEAIARGALGMLVQVREGSMARNLDVMLPGIADGRLRGWCLCTDDILPEDLLRDGHIDGLLKRLVAGGILPIPAWRHASLLPARHYGLRDRGAVAPGWRADLAVFADLESFRCTLAVHAGRIVARDGAFLDDRPAPPIDAANTVRLGALDESAFRVAAGDGPVPVIGLVPEQIVTRRIDRAVPSRDGAWRFDPAEDLAMVACVQRHAGDGAAGCGLVQGFGFARDGAIATTVGHDAHNLVVAGTNARDMLAAARALEAAGGGCVAVADGTVRALLPLPFAGLMSLEPAERVLAQQRDAEAAAAALGVRIPSPYGMLSFLPLTVIPEIRITDVGVFDVTRWALEA